MAILLIVIVLAGILYLLGLFKPVVNLANVATRESELYDNNHFVKTMKEYETMGTDVDMDKVKENVNKISELKKLKFD